MTEYAVSQVAGRIQTFQSTQAGLDAALAGEHGVMERTDRLLALSRYRTRWLEILSDVRGGLLDGMWITTVEPVGELDRTGITGLSIKGMGFLDKVKDAKVVGEFAAALGRTRYFSGHCKVEQISYPAEYVLEFTVAAPFKEPMTLRQEP
jgi:hypothetical protein